MKTTKSNAMRLLDGQKIPYTPHTYAADDGAVDGVSVALKTGRELGDVFKTLVLKGASGGLYVFCIPVADELDLKRAAKAAGEKSIAMLPSAELLGVTGYHRGGCSPLGMKKKFPTFLDASARERRSILVSGGRVGLQIELAPADLLRAVGAVWLEA